MGNKTNSTIFKIHELIRFGNLNLGQGNKFQTELTNTNIHVINLLKITAGAGLGEPRSNRVKCEDIHSMF